MEHKNNEKHLAVIDDVQLKVVSRTSKKGNEYRAIIAVINGVECLVGFHGFYTARAFSKAGVDVAMR